MGGSRILAVPFRRGVLAVTVATGTLLGVVVAGPTGPSVVGSSTPAPLYEYASTTDGTQIALVVTYPDGYSAGQQYPALFEMDGYEGGGGALDPSEWANRYVMVHASVRGTGCSTGQFDLFSWTAADDGAQLVENWIPSQSWSDGNVGIIGHSYPGITGFMTAERIGYDLAQPDYSPYGGVNHLKATALSGLVDDLYAGITYMGGIPDLGFPLAWAGFIRPESEWTGNLSRIQSSTEAGDPSCLAAYSQHELGLTALNPDLTAAADNPIVNGATDTTEGPWWTSHSLDTYSSWLRFTDAPVHIDQQYQDEQTGPRGGERLFQEIESMDSQSVAAGDKPLPYRIVFTNGRHDSAGPVYHPDEQNWLDCYVGGASATLAQSACNALGQPDGAWQDWTNDGDGGLTHPSTSTTDPCPGESVLTYFESTGNFETTGDPGDEQFNPPMCASAFPVPGSQWTRYYLNPDGSLSTTGQAGSRSYLSSTVGPDDYLGPTETGIDPAAVQLYDGAVGPASSSPGPEELTYETSAFTSPTTVDGPIEADLYTTSTAPDTDYFVQLVDVASDGSRQFLQYGLLRASLRAFDPSGSQCVSGSGALESCSTAGAGAEMIWPDHPFTDSVLLTPDQTYEVNVEIYPLGWVLRPGHRLMVTISAPPAMDQLYSWSASLRPTGVNTVLAGGSTPSSIVVPLLSEAPDLPVTAPACGAQEGVRCSSPLEATTASGLP